MSETFRQAGFCPRCDYAIEKFVIESMRFNLPCPRCNEEKVSDFYSFGSEMHRQRRRLWELDEVKGQPLPFPDDSGEEWKQGYYPPVE